MNHFGSGDLTSLLLRGVADLDDSIFDLSTDTGIGGLWTRFKVKLEVGTWNGNIANGRVVIGAPVIIVFVADDEAAIGDGGAAGTASGTNDVDGDRLLCVAVDKPSGRAVACSGKSLGWFSALAAI